MFLKALTIKGFKSFADSAQLVMEPGVTVVVGPNGSGKSNVVDAIGWVLGAQAPSAVRSQKMDDVIFAGTQKRPALGRAEVSLTIDNSAGLLPIEFTEVTLTRTLFRSGDSEYSINGVPCRLLDIQELLSDTGVGRQQHVIISQGQIDAVLNARPEDRRLIIEEAAGVLKFRRRKEKAERRLSATEANLLRVQDMLREVRRQLRPLEKQADAARRHGSVVAELQQLRIYVAGQELLRLRQRLAVAERDRRTHGADESEVREQLRRLDADVIAAESKLSAMGGDDLGDTLVRFESLRERGRGQAALLAERTRGLERERAAAIDEAVIASLEADAARIAEELEGVEASRQGLGPELDQLGLDEEALERARHEFQEQWGDGVSSNAAGDAAELRTRLAAARAAVERGDAERKRVRHRVRTIEERLGRADPEVARLRTEAADAVAIGARLSARCREADAAVTSAEEALTAAEGEVRQADAERHSWQARADALGDALDQARARAGAARLDGLDGVIGTLLDVVDVDPGWQDAFEAAAGEALGAVVVDGPNVGRRALTELRGAEVSAAILALDPAAGVPRQPRPPGGEAVRGHVRGTRPGVDTLLDVLVGSAVAVDGWETAVDLVLANPGAVVVTKSGDRFAPTGWRLGAQGEGATAAAHGEAVRRAAAAADAVGAAEAEVAKRRKALADARGAASEAARAVDENERAGQSATVAADRLTDESHEMRSESDELRPLLTSLDQQVERDRAEVAEVERLLPAAEAAESAAADQVAAMATARREVEDQASALAKRRRDLEVRAAGFDERRELLRRRLDEVDERLSRNVEQRKAAEARRVDLDAKLAATRALAAFVDERLVVVESDLATVRERRRRQSEAAREVAASLEAVRKDRTDAEKRLSEVREKIQRAEIDHAEVQLRVESAVEALRRDLDCEPDDAMGAEHPDLPEGMTPPARVRELERDLRLMGPINPLALEEFEALQERHQFLEAQLEDVKSTRRDLGKVIKAIDSEIVNVFASAYADVAQNFTDLFDTLFPGGKGRLRLTEPDNLLETGIEVEARPSGKNVRKLSLLSGGERSLTALAYLFAVFRARPSPFYVMDEVEAALDDVNLNRFLGLVHEFRAEAQLIIVSHQKRTMEAADCLYGVTMRPGGSSHVVSERVTA